MKCPRCNGDGSVPYHIADDLFDETNCPLCGGSGEVLTNEEWLHTMNAEQLAEWFINSGFLTCTLRDCEDCKYYDKNNDDCIDGYEATHDKQMWVEWLKQPHTNE